MAIGFRRWRGIDSLPLHICSVTCISKTGLPEREAATLPPLYKTQFPRNQNESGTNVVPWGKCSLGVEITVTRPLCLVKLNLNPYDHDCIIRLTDSASDCNVETYVGPGKIERKAASA